MKKAVTIFLVLLLMLKSWAQTGFKMIVPQLPIVAGESFQVQYIIEEGDKTANVKPPVFSNFRYVTGPNIYMGSITTPSGIKTLRNTVYTLEATRPGKFIIPGASITVNGKIFRSNDAVVEVISKETAFNRFNKENGTGNSDFFLQPGENAYEKIKQNLFVKLMVDKRNCFVGEPVLATFKLYSRLESKSDIIKNPGFYGFTVYDMVNLSDKEMVTEKVNGKMFDVHTIRKVQLYPLQAGDFTIDAMQVNNKVEFSHSAVNKKAEQEIIEGVLGGGDPESSAVGTETYETNISTEPIIIKVKPVPEKNKPAAFASAVGRFKIAASVVNNNIAKNEQGFLEIAINGKGNFIQLIAPVVQWPAGMEGFEATVKDELDKTKLPLEGRRVFLFPFVCASPGSYNIPSISFSFFDTDSNNYKTIGTEDLEITVLNTEKKEAAVVEEHKVSIAEKSEKAAKTAGIVVVSLVVVILAYWIFIRKEPVVISQPLNTQPQLTSAEELLAPVYASITDGGNRFYSTLHTAIWKFAREHFDLTGSEMNKQELKEKMEKAGVGASTAAAIIKILEQSEAGIYTSAVLTENRQDIIKKTEDLFTKLNSNLFKQI